MLKIFVAFSNGIGACCSETTRSQLHYFILHLLIIKNLQSQVKYYFICSFVKPAEKVLIERQKIFLKRRWMGIFDGNTENQKKKKKNEKKMLFSISVIVIVLVD